MRVSAEMAGGVGSGLSAKQLPTVEVFYRKHIAFKIWPPNPCGQVVCGLPDGPQHEQKHRPTVVIVELLSCVGGHAMRQERIMIERQQRLFSAAPAVGKPQHCDHVGKIGRACTDRPVFPIEDPNLLALTIVRKKAIPPVRIAMDESEVLPRIVTREQIGCRIEQSFVETSAFSGHDFAEAIDEAGELIPGKIQMLRPDFVGWTPCESIQTWIVPQRGMQSPPCLHDAFALQECGR